VLYYDEGSCNQTEVTVEENLGGRHQGYEKFRRNPRDLQVRNGEGRSSDNLLSQAHLEYGR